MATMTPEQFQRQLDYQVPLTLAREMVEKGIINEDDFDKVEAGLREKYNPLICYLKPIDDATKQKLWERHGSKKSVDELAPSVPAEDAQKPKRKNTRKQKPEVKEEAPAPEPEAKAEPEPEPEPEIVVEPEPVAEPAPAPTADSDISEEDLRALLHSLVLLDRAGNVDAQEKLAAVKGILVS